MLINEGDFHVSIKMVKSRLYLCLGSCAVCYHQIMGREGTTGIIVPLIEPKKE